mmetsp:Transcript_5279/g.16589  ORF Transcript_5279/g.16589 Transcript_5279/m.16589 type:complete len:205 (+) Transcript_5279:414-1028(+)
MTRHLHDGIGDHARLADRADLDERAHAVGAARRLLQDFLDRLAIPQVRDWAPRLAVRSEQVAHGQNPAERAVVGRDDRQISEQLLLEQVDAVLDGIELGDGDHAVGRRHDLVDRVRKRPAGQEGRALRVADVLNLARAVLHVFMLGCDADDGVALRAEGDARPDNDEEAEPFVNHLLARLKDRRLIRDHVALVLTPSERRHAVA